MSNTFIKLSAFSLLCASTIPAFAAQAVDLSGRDISFLRSFSSSKTLAAKTGAAVGLDEVSQSIDFNQTLHVRVKQTYAGYPVWGGDAVLHIPNGQRSKTLSGLMASADKSKSSMNGTVYQDLQKDLQGTPDYIFHPSQAEKAMEQAIAKYETKSGKKEVIENKQSRLVAYVDEENKARWAFYVSFYVKRDNARPALPTFLMDAVSLKIYREWDEVKTLDNVAGGGFGGNVKVGKYVYDGLQGHLPRLDIVRDAAKKTCYLRNDEVTVADYRKGETKAASFSCANADINHNNVYWNGSSDEINGGYSPNHDALYAGKIISGMYKSWYQTAPLKDSSSKSLMLTMVTHSPNYQGGRPDPDNAFWDPIKQKMYFGDGETYFYPLTSLGVASHEISHGFTEQNASLVYDQQSGGMNEAFSDMAAQAAEFYSTGKNSWQIGPEITKTQELPVLRYMDQPSKDCNGGKPGGNPSDFYSQCSIDQANQYYSNLNVHYSSGVYNRAFYLLATASGWNVKKAFDVMVKANQHYWTSTTNFEQGACGVVSATNDYGYDLNGVYSAFEGVGIDAKKCSVKKA